MHLSSDGEVVLFHDDTLDRTTDGQGPLGDRSFAELRELDAGYHFQDEAGGRPYRGRGERIPTLAELAQLDEELFINVEIKPRDLTAPRRLLEEIDALGIAERVLVASAEHRPLVEFRRLAGPRVPTSASRREIIEFLARVRLGFGWPKARPCPFVALQVPPSHYGITVIDSNFVSAAHRRGVHVHAWTIDSPEQMRRLVKLGVDGIMSDLPELLTRTLDCASGA
jgi:glycerophosphoryl diester phosphodiesterase